MQRILFFILIIGGFSILSFIWESIMTVSRQPYFEYGSVILYDQRGEKIAERGKAGGYMTPYSGSLDIPLIRNIINIEDARFYRHHGVNIEAKIGSIIANYRAGTVIRGGSTITEQYIKNAYYPDAERTILQKLRETIGALYLETRYTKDQILGNYLNSVYLGNRLYGIGSALVSYYPEQNAASLSNEDILDIITRIHSPNVNQKNLPDALKYRNTAASRLSIPPGNNHLLEHTRTNYIDQFPLLTDRILSALVVYCQGKKTELEKFMISTDENLCTGNTENIQLSVDAKLMQFIEDTIKGVLTPLEKENVHHAAVYIYDPSKKKVLAYVANKEQGGTDASRIDMITKRRSVGSVLKPFIYLLALRDGADSESFVIDNANYIYPTGYYEKVFVPQNYVPKSYGPVRLREALGNSLNSSTVRISEKIGIGKIYDFFRTVGLDMDHDAGYYGYGISIGTVELPLENVVEAFTYLTRLDDKDIFLINEILRDSSNRAKTFGISSILNTSVPLPVKTGTSTDFRDNWTLSYNKHAIIGVWIGNADASPMEDVSGVSGAGPIWHRIAEYMIGHGFITHDTIPTPSGISEQSICLDTSCFQKEIRYSKLKKSPRSRILDHIYYNEDFYTPLTEEERYEWNVR